MHMRFATIAISDEDRAVDFYQNKLGFALLVDNPMPVGRFLMFAPPDGGTNLVMTKPLPGRPGPGGFSGIAFEVDDAQATYEALRAKGVEFTEPPKRAFWGGLEARFADPDGNQFLLQQGAMVRSAGR